MIIGKFRVNGKEFFGIAHNNIEANIKENLEKGLAGSILHEVKRIRKDQEKDFMSLPDALDSCFICKIFI